MSSNALSANEFDDMSDADVTMLAVMQTLGAVQELVHRIDERQGRMEGDISSIRDTVRETDKRVLVIESNSINTRVEALEADMKVVKEKEAIRLGHQQAASAMQKYSPMVLVAVLAIVALVQAGFLKVSAGG